MIYTFVYEEGQSYGGPEEGGWWYSTGEPVDHPLNRVWPDDQMPEARAYCQLHNRTTLPEQNREEGRHQPYSVLSRGDYLRMILDVNEIPAPYPKERPHYD